MNKIQLVAVLSTLLLSATALHLGGEHLAYDNTADYLQGLLSQQSKFQAQIAALNQDVNQTVSAANSATDIANKIAILEQGILNQENQIFLTSTTLIPKLVLKDQCQNITEADKTALINKCQTTIQDIQTLLNKLKALPQDARVLELEASANHQIYYLNTIQTVLQQNCTTAAILSPTVYQSNIYAPNWITGNQTFNDIVDQYVARSRQYDNITNCPLSNPFYNGAACINCTNPTPIFDMKALVCTACPQGQVLDTQAKTCVQGAVPTPNVTNATAATNNLGALPVNGPYDVPCPATTPYFNGTGCVNCVEPTPLFNATSLTCVSCPTGSTFNSTSHSCNANKPNVTNPVILEYPNVTGTLPPTTQYDIPCPVSAPIYYNGNCYPDPCPAAYPIFNVTAFNCIACQNGSVWNTTTKTCQLTTVTPVLPNGSNLLGQNRTVGNLVPGSVPCPPQTPFFNGQTCINCVEPNPIFNATSNQCSNCAGGYYNSTDNHCYYYNGTNPIYNTSIINPTPLTNQYTVYCPAQTPYFNGTTCIGCNGTTPYFDQAQLVCVQCQNGTYYNPANHTCQSLAPNATNPSGNSTSLGPIAAPGPYDIPCPTNNPYYVNGQCVACAAPTPYFNTTSQSCANCPTGSSYNATSQSCQAAPTPAGPYISNLNATNWVSNSPFKDYVENGQAIANGSATPCPLATPYFNGQSCISCPQLFNLTTRQCVSCPAGTTYNAYEKKCAPNNQTYITNPNTAGNLFYGPYPANLWKNWYSSNITNYHQTDCVAPTPYWNEISCISCPADYPLFDLQMRDCVRCPTDSTFSNGQCINTATNQLSPNLASMAATAFTHQSIKSQQHAFRHRIL